MNYMIIQIIISLIHPNQIKLLFLEILHQKQKKLLYLKKIQAILMMLRNLQTNPILRRKFLIVNLIDFSEFPIQGNNLVLNVRIKLFIFQTNTISMRVRNACIWIKRKFFFYLAPIM
uniref:hypothetical protein n=1 Tax=Inonotus hispidus TaxID=40469 RepID=UPI0021822958|nr:hypothetical protein N4M07_mgp010 [Inonotus hispidus]UVF37948.1 hypothetical protein [Inonotus hispidus]